MFWPTALDGGAAIDPSVFSPDACMAFEPVGPARHVTVFLDAGVHSDVGLGSTLSSMALAYGHLVLLGPADPGYVSSPSRMPAALIEPLFITDPFEGSIAASRHGQEVIAGGLAKAIEQYFAHGS